MNVLYFLGFLVVFSGGKNGWNMLVPSCPEVEISSALFVFQRNQRIPISFIRLTKPGTEFETRSYSPLEVVIFSSPMPLTKFKYCPLLITFCTDN